MIDLHVHTSRCGHAEGDPDEYLAAAVARGVETLAFCDHLPLPDGFPSGYAMPARELPDYIGDVHRLAAASAREGATEVLLGIEADWLPGHVDFVRSSLAGGPFDVVLGSVHFFGEWAFDDPDHIEGYRAFDIDTLWERYFAELVAAASSGLYDVMAHPDLIKKFRFMPEADPRGWYEQAAEAFAGAGVAVEVNTGGLRKPCAEIYPTVDLLRACEQRGVPATVGSDAHAAAEVGYGWDAARALLTEAGYRSVVVFRGREAQEVAL